METGNVSIICPSYAYCNVARIKWNFEECFKPEVNRMVLQKTWQDHMQICLKFEVYVHEPFFFFLSKNKIHF